MRVHARVLVMVASAALLAGCSSSTNKATGGREVKPVVLTLANPNVGDADVGDWAKAVERLSNGTVRIHVRGDWRLDEVLADRGTLDDVRSGRVDLAKIPARAWDTLGVSSFQALQAPLLVDSLELERRVLSSGVGAEMLGGVRAAGVEPVALLPGPLRHPLGVTRDLVGPADYRDARIGSRPSAVAAATTRALGGRYVEIASGGSLDGLDGFDASLDGLGYDKQARSLTADVVLWPRAATIVVNRNAWQRLAPEQRTALTRAARAAERPLMRALRSFQRGGIQSLCRQRFALVRAGATGITRLRRAVEPVYRHLEADSVTRRILTRIRDLKQDTPAEPRAPCQNQNTPSASSHAPLVGTWHARVTRELMTRANRETGEAVEDNYGDVTLVLSANGRFEVLNSRFSGEPIGLGSWSSRGSVLEMKPEGTVAQGAGETWRYRWTLFHGSLVLHKVTLAPTALTVAPLRRR